MNNPFVTNGYVSPKYFCDRETETKDITTLLLNGNNIALISPRRYGKTDLIRHCFSQPEVAEHYYTFIVDIYATRSLRDFVNKFGKVILDALKPRGRKVWEIFVNAIASLQAGITYDIGGVPSWNIGLGDITNPAASLDEIFHYLQHIYIVYFSYYILFSDNSFCSVFSFSSPYRSPFFPHTNKQTGHHSYRNRKYS